MHIYHYLNQSQLQEVLKRPIMDTFKIEKIVKPILDKVRRGGDRALKKLVLEYDHIDLDELWVPKNELKDAEKHVNANLKIAIEVAKKNINTLKKDYPYKYGMTKDGTLKTQDVLFELNKHIKYQSDNLIFTSGVGNHQMMASQFIKWRYPKSFISSGSLGTMGVGLPYPIGCQIAHPDKLVIDIDGDGSFNHSLHELKTVNVAR